MANEPGNPISKNPGTPLWKRFMVTDVERVERVSGELHARAQPVEGVGIGILPEKEKLARTEAKAPDSEKKSDVYHDPEPDPMPKPEIESSETPKNVDLGGREVFLKPLLPFGIEERAKSGVLPSRSGDLLLGFRNPGTRLGKPGILISKMKGLNEPKEKKED